MQRPMRILLLLPTLAFASGCNLLAPPEDEEASGTVFLWVSSDKDAYTSCGGVGCPEGGNNYGTQGFLPVANNPPINVLKKGYVHFTPPTFPEGTEIQEAYFEMFHGATMEDGHTDDIDIPVAEGAGAWSPLTLTHANQPNPDLTGSFTTINLKSNAWSGTPNIADRVIAWHDTPSSNNGLVTYWVYAGAGVEKGFSSNNHTSRTATDLGQAPRLLIKAKFPDGTSTSDMQLGALPADNDIDLGTEVLMVRFQSGDDWPEEWAVTRGL